MNDELSNVRMAEFAECVWTSVIFNQASASVCHFTTASEPFGWIEGLYLPPSHQSRTYKARHTQKYHITLQITSKIYYC